MATAGVPLALGETVHLPLPVSLESDRGGGGRASQILPGAEELDGSILTCQTIGEYNLT